MKLRHSYMFRSILVFILITTLCFCVTCSSYEKTGSSVNDPSDATVASATNLEHTVRAASDAGLFTHTLTASAPLRFNFAAEETLSNTASSCSAISMFSRTGTNQGRGLLLMQFIFIALLFGFLHNREVSFCSAFQRNELPSLCITRYIESSDGKK